MKKRIRSILWRLLGIDYNHIMKVIDAVYLKEDKHTSVGHKSYDNHALVYRWSDAPLEIGRYCSISYHVKFILDDGKHGYNQVTNYPFHSNEVGDRRGIIIGNEVWIGMGATILNGIKIGNGVTVAAGAVVTHDIPDYCVVAGVPAKILRYRFDEATIKELLASKWWEWSDEKLAENKEWFSREVCIM